MHSDEEKRDSLTPPEGSDSSQVKAVLSQNRRRSGRNIFFPPLHKSAERFQTPAPPGDAKAQSPHTHTPPTGAPQGSLHHRAE